ncbi:MAG: restriction endonuclease subunit S [Muribaculum sp.]|nr:restriction endonuclease subunit S [Muribaculum sp.]
MRLKDLFELRNGYTPSKAVPEFWDGGTIPWFRMEDIRTNGRILSDSIQHITKEAVKTAGLFEANSFIMATTATIGEHAWLIVDSLANQQFTNLKIRKSLIDSVNLKYIYFLLFPIGESCKRHCRVTTFPAVDMNEFKNFEFDLPPLAEQEAIAAYLDKECEKIGREIELLERKTDGYRRLRSSLINRVVTRGLNPNAPLKSSEYGLLPEHWDAYRLKDLYIMYGGISGKKGEDFQCDEDNPNAKRFIKYTNILNNFCIENRNHGLCIIYDSEQQNEVRKDDLLFLMSSEDYVSIGLSSVVDEDMGQIYLNSFCKGLRPTTLKVISKFLAFQLRAEHVHDALRYEARGFTRVNLKVDKVMCHKVFVPPIHEQREIVAYLDEKCGKIDAIVEKIETKIERLKELKRSLINEVVTGQRAINTSEL